MNLPRIVLLVALLFAVLVLFLFILRRLRRRSAPAREAAPPSSSSEEAGKFIRVFDREGRSADDAPEATAPPSATSAEPGEYTRVSSPVGQTEQKRQAKKRVEEGRAAPVPKTVDVNFTAYYPKQIRAAVWHCLLAYVHTPNAFDAVQADSRKHLGTEWKEYGQGLAKSPSMIERGTEIVVVPSLPGCRFNPPRASVLWLEDWHRVELRIQADPELPGFEAGTAVNGRVSFYVGPVLVGEVKIWTHLLADTDATPNEPDSWDSAEAYQAIFVSYSHQDAAIVEKLEKAYTALGMQYLRDVRTLRSGEQWNPTLLKKIEEADVFQLCWSRKAKSSAAVEQEWRHALKQHKSHFIRPVYWETPMPECPPELSGIHFAFLEW